MNLPLPKFNQHLYTADEVIELCEAARSVALDEAAIDAERYGHLWSGAPAKAFFELAEQIRSTK